MSFQPTRNHFELFDLPVAFDVDGETLSLRYRDLQRAVHPDRYANASDRERRLAVQQAANINEGYRVLRDPLARARYLLELKGVALDDTDTAMDPAFLMEQMELREALGEVRGAQDPFAALNAVRDDIERHERELMQALAALFARDDAGSLEQAREQVRKLQFMNRLLDEVERLEEDLVHSSH